MEIALQIGGWIAVILAIAVVVWQIHWHLGISRSASFARELAEKRILGSKTREDRLVDLWKFYSDCCKGQLIGLPATLLTLLSVAAAVAVIFSGRDIASRDFEIKREQLELERLKAETTTAKAQSRKAEDDALRASTERILSEAESRRAGAESALKLEMDRRQNAERIAEVAVLRARDAAARDLLESRRMARSQQSAAAAVILEAKRVFKDAAESLDSAPFKFNPAEKGNSVGKLHEDLAALPPRFEACIQLLRIEVSRLLAEPINGSESRGASKERQADIENVLIACQSMFGRISTIGNIDIAGRDAYSLLVKHDARSQAQTDDQNLRISSLGIDITNSARASDSAAELRRRSSAMDTVKRFLDDAVDFATR